MEAELKQQQARRKFAEVAESFSNTVYEQSDSLQPVADKLKLKIQTAKGVVRTPAPGMCGAVGQPEIPGSPVLPGFAGKQAQYRGGGIRSQPDGGRPRDAVHPARTLAFDEVQAQVRQRYVAEQSAELARKEGEAKRTAWADKASGATGLSAPLVVARDQPQNQPCPVVDAVLSVRADELPAWTGVDMGDLGYVVAKVNRVLPQATPEPQISAQRHQQYVQWWSEAEGLAYYETPQATLQGGDQGTSTIACNHRK